MLASSILKALAAGLLSAGVVASAAAQGSADRYPSRPVKILVGFSAGGPTDLTARMIAGHLQSALGQSFVVENRPGAGSNLASEQVAAAAPDGYTLLVAAAPLAINGSLYKNLRYDALRSFEPISQIMSAPSVLAVHPSVPARTLNELIALARKQPDKLTYSSSGLGGSQHLAGALFEKRAGIKLVHLPYKGAAPALNDLVGGHVTMGFMTSLSAIPYLQNGRLVPIAVAAAKRLPQLPDVPTMAQAGLPGFEVDSWNGLLAPAGTPPEIVDKLYRAVAAAVATAEVRNTLAAQAAVPVGSSPAEFRATLKREVEDWGALIRSIGLTLE